MKIKAGYKTSEFWFTLVSFIFSGFYLTGILTENEHKEELISVVSHAVESVILVGGQAYILYKYVKGRTEIKKIVEQEELEKIKVTPSKPRGKKNVPKRTSTKPSRKTSSSSKRKPKRS
jgi:hypothetical protein